MNKLCKIIRVLTVAPLAAAVAVSLLYFRGKGFFQNGLHYVMSLLTLTVLPLLAYPVSLIKKKDSRRKFQRSLAIVFAVLGYIAGLIFALCTGAPNGEKVLYLTYLLSGLAIALSSFVFKYKSSGHACGIAGPAALLFYYLSPYYLISFILLIPVSVASVQMKRHTVPQLITGSIIPIVCMFIAIGIIST